MWVEVLVQEKLTSFHQLCILQDAIEQTLTSEKGRCPALSLDEIR